MTLELIGSIIFLLLLIGMGDEQNETHQHNSPSPFRSIGGTLNTVTDIPSLVVVNGTKQ